MNSTLSALKEFILPGGGLAAAAAHVARTGCRRAERELFSFLDAGAIEHSFLLESDATKEDFGLSYLNRLSDLLFVIARIQNRASGGGPEFWERGKSLG